MTPSVWRVYAHNPSTVMPGFMPGIHVFTT